MLFFDITEYSSPANNKRQNMATTTMTPGSQFYWRQSNAEQQHAQRERGNPAEEDATTTTATAYYDDDSNPTVTAGGDYYDQEEPAFRSAAASANRVTTSNAERRHQQRHSPLRGLTKQAIPAPEADTADVKPAHECVQKPKTRAERRANDAPLTEVAVLVDPVTKRERRSDYWVQRDDERRSAARMFKTQGQAPALSEEESDEDYW